MCVQPRLVYTVCSHVSHLAQEDCSAAQIVNAARQLGGFFLPGWIRSSCGPAWAKPICTTTIDYRLAYGFCPSCRAVLMQHGEIDETTIMNYWAYKNSKALRQPVDPEAIPPNKIFRPRKPSMMDARLPRLEMVTLSEAFHVWNEPDVFVDSQAYKSWDTPNPVEFLEKIRSATLRGAARIEASGKSYSTGKDLANIGQNNEPTAYLVSRVPPSGLSEAGYTTHSSMVYEPDNIDELNAQNHSWPPKGKGKATDSPPRDEYRPSKEISAPDPDFEAARQASIRQLLGSRYMGEAGSSKPYEFAGSHSSDSGATERILVTARDYGTISTNEDISFEDYVVSPLSSPVPSGLNLVRDNTHQSDADSQASSPLVSPVSDKFTSSVRHHSDATPADSSSCQQTLIFHNRPWDSGSSDNGNYYDNLASGMNASDVGIMPVTAQFLQDYTQSDRSDTELLPTIPYVPYPVLMDGETQDLASASQPSPENPSDQVMGDVGSGEILQPRFYGDDVATQSPTSAVHQVQSDINDRDSPQESLSQMLAENGFNDPGELNSFLSRIPVELPVPSPFLNSRPEDLETPNEYIDALFSRRFNRSPPSESPSPLPCSSYVSASPIAVSNQDPLYYNPFTPTNHFQSTRCCSPQVSERRIGAIRVATPSLIRTNFAQPAPLSAPRVRTPVLAQSPSAEIQSMYHEAIREGEAVLSTTPPVTGWPKRRKSGMTPLALPALSLRTGLRSAPPFPSRRGRPFEEVAVTAVCFCREMGKGHCECPRVVGPVVWI